jgi:hypothetical protein
VIQNQKDGLKAATTATATAPKRPKVAADWGEMVQAGTALLAKDWWEPEHTPDGEWFVWGGAAAEITLPPLPRGTRVELDVMPHRGPAPIGIVVNGKKVRQLDGDASRQCYWVNEEAFAANVRNRVAFVRAQGYVPSSRDPRLLSVQLFGVRAVGQGSMWAGVIAAQEERARSLVTATGVLDPEQFPEGRGAWTKPEAKLFVPAGPGKLTITLWAPRPKPPAIEISVRGAKLAGPIEVGHDPMKVDISLTAEHVAKGGVELDLKATPFCPAKEGVSSDRRELGVVLAHVQFVPSKS